MPAKIEAFLTDLAVRGQVSASTQNQAFYALLFLYREVLKQALPEPINALRAKPSQRLPVVLTRSEVQVVLDQLTGEQRLMVQLRYGSGLRLMECLRLRVKDLDFGQNQIIVRAGKRDKDRVSVLPQWLHEPLKQHLARVRRQHQQDLHRGYGTVYLPNALARKYPNASREWGWHYVFPAATVSKDPRSEAIQRHHYPERTLQAAVRRAAQQAHLVKPVSCHTFRHCFGRPFGRLVKISMDMTCHQRQVASPWRSNGSSAVELVSFQGA